MRFKLLAALVLLATTLAVAQAPDAKPLRILFIGNGLTSATDVPGRLARLARAMGKEAEVESVAVNGFHLEDHWRDGRARDAIGKGWDYVVLQQGASVADACKDLVDYAKRFARSIRAAGAKPAPYMVWPEIARPRDFEQAIRSYREAAQEVKGLLNPAGEAWLRALEAERHLGLYGDGLHPSALGSHLVVLTMYLSFFPVGRELEEAYVAKIAASLEIPADKRDLLFDAATHAIDAPMRLRGRASLTGDAITRKILGSSAS